MYKRPRLSVSVDPNNPGSIKYAQRILKDLLRAAQLDQIAESIAYGPNWERVV